MWSEGQWIVVQWCQFVIVLHASWLQHVTFHHFPRLALCKALGWPAVYNTSHSACCSSMKFLFIEATGVQRVICLFWMRSGGFDKVSWIKALGGGGGGWRTGHRGWLGWEGHHEKTGCLYCMWWSMSAHYLVKCRTCDEAELAKHLLKTQTPVLSL